MVGCRAGRPSPKNGVSDRKISGRPRRVLANSGAEVLGTNTMVLWMRDVRFVKWGEAVVMGGRRCRVNGAWVAK